MRLGAPITAAYSDPEGWIQGVKEAGYRAAYCPISSDSDSATIQAYAEAARSADIVIAEVGAWNNNPVHPDDAVRQAAVEHIQRQLAFADEIGAACCVNVAGSRDPGRWDGPHMDNMSQDTFDLIVETTRQIIDAVKPKRTFFTLEPMPWMPPDSPDNYLELFNAIDRDRFGVHLDPINIMITPRIFMRNGDFLRECFAKLGPHIKSIHAKDMVMSGDYTVHLTEVRPGLGQVDYGVFLREANKLPADTPFLLEHLPQAEYLLAAEYVRSVAQAEDIAL